MKENEQRYLDSLPDEVANKPILIKPYNLEIANIAQGIIDEIKEQLPNAEIKFMGASALGISGQNDIDIYVLEPKSNQDQYYKVLESLFGQQIKHKWSWNENGFEISIYLADPTEPSQKVQIDIFNALKHDPKLLQKYEALKTSLNGKTYREYQTAKYEFYNEVLDRTDDI